MGKGDRKTAKGKRYNSSYGNARPHSSPSVTAAQPDAARKVPSRTPAKKTVARKVVVKAG